MSRGTLLHLVVASLCFLVSSQLFGQLVSEDCTPKRNCDATRDCSLQVDTRDCEPHWGCDNFFTKPGCELDKARYKTQCEAAKAAQNQMYAAQKAACESQKSLEKLDCERIKTEERLGCEAGLAGPFSCRAQEVANALRTTHNRDLTDFDKWSALLTTPGGKGIIGWRSTACAASGVGRLYRDPKRSQDGLWTVDVELLSIDIGGVQKPNRPAYLRLEVKPARFGGGHAHDFFDTQTIHKGDTVKFQGPVWVDKDGPFLEVHPGDTFERVAAQ